MFTNKTMQPVNNILLCLTLHCSRLHHTCSLLCHLVAAILVFSAVCEILPVSDDSITFFILVDEHYGHAQHQKEQHKNLGTQCPLQYHINSLLSNKMALALCAQLAHLSVLKLSSELHGGGTGRVLTLESLHTAL